jgi:Gpi18-like mannosyltransferase
MYWMSNTNRQRTNLKHSGASATSDGAETRLLVLAVVLVGISIAVRIAARNVVTSDLEAHILPWYAKLQKHGIFIGLGKDFYNYTPPYVYLLAGATLVSSWVPAVLAVKLIAAIFDVVAALLVYKIVRIERPRGNLPVLAAAVFFAAPTVVANAGVWGQADSTYTAFLLAFLYCILQRRPLLAVLFFGSALAFKPQAVFLAPFLVLMMLWRIVPWLDSLLVPAVYAAWMWPAVLLGRTWPEVLFAYPDQAGSGKGLTHNAATLYVFIPKSAFDVLIRLGIGIALTAALIWVVWSAVQTKGRGRPLLVLLALISATITPFFLPNMHDRYFYVADTLSIALAFIVPTMWLVPIGFQVASGLAYSIYLAHAPSENLVPAAVLNFLLMVWLVIAQARLGSKAEEPPGGLATSSAAQ